MVNHVADSQGQKTCTMTRIQDEILIECGERGADGVLCDLCRGRHDGVLEMLWVGMEHPEMQVRTPLSDEDYFRRRSIAMDCGCSIGSNNCGCWEVSE